MKLFFKSLYHKYYRFQSFKVLGRTACLGNEIIKQMGWGKNYINHQKSRVDYLLDLNKNNYIFSNADEILKYLKHTFIIGTIEYQRYDFFRYPKPDIIVMDSFSELTDQLFIDKISGKRFLANYSDIKHDINFKNKFENNGLIKISDLEKAYDDFFDKLSNIYPDTKVIFIHFPTILDNREKFQKRGEFIINTINKLSIKYSFLYSVSMEDEFISKSEDERDELKDFPYHYGQETYENFVEKVKKIIYV